MSAFFAARIGYIFFCFLSVPECLSVEWFDFQVLSLFFSQNRVATIACSSYSCSMTMGGRHGPDRLDSWIVLVLRLWNCGCYDKELERSKVVRQKAISPPKCFIRKPALSLGECNHRGHREHRWKVELSEIKGIHEAQILTYMKLSGISTGLLINFNRKLLKNGIKRFKL